ncbi:MAG: DNA alkylation repair protein [Euryarchaeota archaeon]|nr:DNA alkylation repair protein [Euryarchaeota archaeon]
MGLSEFRRILKASGTPRRAAALHRFLQAERGGYGEGDRFHGVTVPRLREVARAHRDASDRDLDALLRSPFHEERFLGMLILVDRHRRAVGAARLRRARYYLRMRGSMNNWDLVDTSAPAILGPHLDELGPALLRRLSKSADLWDRRIAVLAAGWEIREGRFDRTLALARRLLGDPEDLIHKAVGWMLREVGKRDIRVLQAFLERHSGRMPRTMLRYAIEKLPERTRRAFLARHS